jgi:hypothetical protein
VRRGACPRHGHRALGGGDGAAVGGVVAAQPALGLHDEHYGGKGIAPGNVTAAETHRDVRAPARGGRGSARWCSAAERAS